MSQQHWMRGQCTWEKKPYEHKVQALSHIHRGSSMRLAAKARTDFGHLHRVKGSAEQSSLLCISDHNTHKAPCVDITSIADISTKGSGQKTDQCLPNMQAKFLCEHVQKGATQLSACSYAESISTIVLIYQSRLH